MPKMFLLEDVEISTIEELRMHIKSSKISVTGYVLRLLDQLEQQLDAKYEINLEIGGGCLQWGEYPRADNLTFNLIDHDVGDGEDDE